MDDKFRAQLTDYLETKSLNDLRCFGRYLGLKEPTKFRKQALIDQLVASICDGVKQTRTRRGAPVKEKVWDTKIIEDIENLKTNCFIENLENIERKNEQTQEGTPNKVTPLYVQQTQNLQIVIPIQSCTETQKNLLLEFLKSF